MIKNAIVYSVEMPDAQDMAGLIFGLLLAKKPTSHEIRTIGFTPHPITGEYVSKFTGGYCLSILKWEKKIDKSAVSERVKEIISTIEKEQDRIVKNKEKTAIKEQVVVELLPTVLPSPKYVFVYFHTTSKTLIVDTTSDKVSDEVTCLLRKSVGSLKATTLYVDNRIGLTEQVKCCLIDNSDFLIPNKVLIGNKLELKGNDKYGGDLKFKDIDLFDDTTNEEICAQIRDGGMYVKSIELAHAVTSVVFTLTDGFKFKKLIFNGFETDWDDDPSALEDWQAETFYAVQVISSVASEIVDHFTVVED